MFVIVECSIYRNNNIWTVKIFASYSGSGCRQVVSQVLRLSRSYIYATSARSDSLGISYIRSWPDTACWWTSWLACTKLSKDVEHTRYPVCDACVYRAKNSVDQWEGAGLSPLDVEGNKDKGMMFYCYFGNCRMLAYKIWACEVCITWRKLFVVCKIQCKSPSRRPDGLRRNSSPNSVFAYLTKTTRCR